jgi:hypothetical protein
VPSPQAKKSWLALALKESYTVMEAIVSCRSFDKAVAPGNDCLYDLSANLSPSAPRKVWRFFTEVEAGTL